jgi:2-dehydro-3-deoxyphosphogluconate aldolase/(4S)-4-hydroxy-2-oxoglutarate aldolase
MAALEERSPLTAVDRILERRVVAILRRVASPESVAVELAAGGIGVVEVTLDSDGALATIERLRGEGGLTVLAGTVRTPADVDRAVAAGAEACVGPAFDPEVVARCLELGVPAVPGALTPTEIEGAWRAGAALVKLFPAGAVGADYVRAVRAPLADVPLLATGGVTAANARAFLDAGAAAVGASIRSREEAEALVAAAGLGSASEPAPA